MSVWKRERVTNILGGVYIFPSQLGLIILVQNHFAFEAGDQPGAQVLGLCEV